MTTRAGRRSDGQALLWAWLTAVVGLGDVTTGWAQQPEPPPQQQPEPPPQQQPEPPPQQRPQSEPDQGPAGAGEEVDLASVWEDDSLFELEALEVEAKTPDDPFLRGGAVNVLGEEQMEAFNYDDPHSVLLQVPGVYVRQEDGFGLRPNIGIRGANSNRSSKITLMEDGVLFGPAPYSAPAAYYFPLVTRMVGVEVFKGASAILFGPHTVGGAINYVGRGIPEQTAGRIDAAVGNTAYGKVHVHYGASNDWGGVMAEVVHLQSDGFKELDSNTGDGGDTGFSRTEVIVKGELKSDQDKVDRQRLRLKLGWSGEDSNETYLGLTDSDFQDNAVRRYVASTQDRLTWNRWMVELRHRYEHGEATNINTTLYRHDMSRVWTRLNEFEDGPPLSDILANPTGSREVYYDVLRGAQDSSSEGETLMVTNNDRTFVSQGIQSDLTTRWGSKTAVHHNLKTGLRFHYDSVDRDHTQDGYLMRDGAMEPDGEPRETTTFNRGKAYALAAYGVYSFEFKGLTLIPGLRAEFIRTEFEDRLDASAEGRWQEAFMPGFSGHFAFTEGFGALAGVHRGFSPVAPGQPEEVEPEQSINYEAGARYRHETSGSLIEAVGFFNDYSNLTGQCTFSSGCSEDVLDRQFNGGAVNVYGIETVLARNVVLNEHLTLPVRATYTYTQSSFQTGFSSDNPQFGEVEVGDELPYVPRNQASLQIRLVAERWNVDLSAAYVGWMWETASQGEPGPSEATDDYLLVDLVGEVSVLERLALYLRIENLLYQQPIVSRRPFGARPGRPFLVQVGMKVDI